MFRNNSSGVIPGAYQPPPNAVAYSGIGGGGVLDQLLGMVAAVADEIPEWSYYPNYRDAVLMKFWKMEPILAGGIYTMITKGSTIGFKLLGQRRNTKMYYQDLFGYCDNGKGLHGVIAQTILALLTQDNGAFWYLHGGGRPDRPLRGRVQDIRFMDQAQCWRSIDPEYPVIYHNPFTGSYHNIHKTRVVKFASMPQTAELARGLGFCAVSRVLQGAQIMRDIRQYKHEKVGGRPSRGLLLMNGINIKQLKAAIDGNKETADNLGYAKFKGIDTLAQINTKIEGQLLDLASIPDGFNEKDDTISYVNLVALSLGTDARELWSATQTGATKGDAEVTDKKSKSKGIAEILTMFRTAMNWQIIGAESGVQFEWDETDSDEQKAQAEIGTSKTNIYKIHVDSGAITPEEMRALSIADGTLNASVLANLAAPESYDDVSPVVDENEAESAMEMPDELVQRQELSQASAQAAIEAENNPPDPAETDQQGENTPPPKQAPKQPKTKAKNDDQGVSIPLDPISGKDIDYAVELLGKLV